MHLLLFAQRLQRLPKNPRGSVVRWHHDAVVHPLPLSPRFYDSRTSEIGKMPGNLWLWSAEDLHEVADANFLVSNKVQEPQTSVVTQCLEEAFKVVGLFSCHILIYTP